jgi:hypothetical protein
MSLAPGNMADANKYLNGSKIGLRRKILFFNFALRA